MFYPELNDFLEHCNALGRKLLIFGDLNTHFDCLSNNNTSRVVEVSQTFESVPGSRCSRVTGLRSTL